MPAQSKLCGQQGFKWEAASCFCQFASFKFESILAAKISIGERRRCGPNAGTSIRWARGRCVPKPDSEGSQTRLAALLGPGRATVRVGGRDLEARRTFYANNGWLRRPGPWPGAEVLTVTSH